MLGNIVWYLAARALGHRSLEADHPALRPLADDQLARCRARPSLVRRARHCLRLLRPADADGALARLDPRRAARHALPQLRHRLDPRHGSWTALLTGAGYKLQENFAQIGRSIGPVSNGVLIVIVIVYIWRLIAHKGDQQA